MNDTESQRKRAEVDVWDAMLQRKVREYVDQGYNCNDAEEKAKHQLTFDSGRLSFDDKCRENETLKAQLAAARKALEPFVKAADTIARYPKQYDERIVMIGGLSEPADLMKRHFADLLAALGKDTK